MNKWTRRAFVTTGVLAGGVLAIGVAVRPGNRNDKVRGLVAAGDESVVNVWVKVAPDNIVTAIVPHADMGQGVHTTLAMMLAEEMDADWNQVEVLEAPAHKEYANYALAKGFAAGDVDFAGFLVDTVDGFFLKATQWMNLQITGGSTSVAATGEHGMRVAGAAAKAVLLQAAAEAWQTPVAELTAKDSRIVHRASGRTAPFAEFAHVAAELKGPAKPQLKSPEEFTLLGTSPPRLDVPGKVDGTATFGLDVQAPGMKYATVKAAPVFGAQVERIDESPLEALEGVHRVINLGDAVAVVADGYWQAKQAIDRLGIEFSKSGNESVSQADIFDQFTAAMDLADADDANEVDVRIGDVEVAAAGSSHFVDAEYRVPFLAHATMEPMNCTAWVRDGQCDLWLGTQNPLGFAADVADALDLSIDDVRVHNQALGGGFGRRAFSDCALQAARIAAQVDHPVKLIWSREEDMRHDFYRQAGVSRFKAALSNDGFPTAWTNQYGEKHDPAEAPHIPYNVPNQLIHFAPGLSHVPWGFWRSVDHSLHAFFTESFIDELARAANTDPFEYRRQLLQHDNRFRRVLDLAAEQADWGSPLPQNFGRGIAIHKSFGTIVAQVVEAEVTNGRVRAHRVVCAVDCGFAMHPDGLIAQMESGIVYGLTAALYGDVSIKDGAVEQSNFHDYEMLRMNEAPVIETHIINSGARVGGAGEPGTPAIAPALANAVFDATGHRVRELPMKNYRFEPQNDTA
ncbi:MAG: molybdopterin cofactor-binding domain-containing protein [Pseudomonadota bacterium]